jgi:Rrf2 family protein
MKLSTRSRYGVRMLMELAQNGKDESMTLNDIATRQNVSLKYLEKITRILKKNGYLEGKRGPHGGYRLTIPPERIHLGDLVEILEGDLELVDCWMFDQSCPRIDHCPTRELWHELRRTIVDKLNSYTLQNLVQNQKLWCFDPPSRTHSS